MSQKILKFNINGPSAFFKDPSVNKETFLTFECISKTHIFGIIGAIMGFSGYNLKAIKKKLLLEQIENENNKEKKENLKEKLNEFDSKFPDFYEKLKDCKVSIIENKNPIKKVHIYNNSTGMSSANGDIYNSKEQWLHFVDWDIYLTTNNLELLNEIFDKMYNKKGIYTPYLGSNSHFCNICNVELLDLESINSNENIIDSIVIVDEDIEIDEDDVEYDYLKYFYLPIGFNKELQSYEIAKFVNTNAYISNVKNLYKVKNKIIQLF